jgi:thimet oligopeptidase
MGGAVFALMTVACNGAHPQVIDPGKSAAPQGPGKAPAAGPQVTVVNPVAVGMTVEGVTKLCDDNLQLARDLLAEIKEVPVDEPKALTWSAVMGRLDDAFLSIGNASEFPYLMGVTHPDKGVREAAQKCEKKTDELMTGVWLDADLAAVVKAYNQVASGLNPERQRFLDHALRDFRRNGLDLPADKQARIRQINEEATEISQNFIKEIGETKGYIEVTKAQLQGLPEAYVESHTADDDGKYQITTDYPDYYPFVKYALDRKAAKELFIKFMNRGGQANVKRLERLLTLRHEKAKMLGYDSWADYAIEPRMAKNAKTALAFLDRVSKAIEPAVNEELKLFRAEFKKVKRRGPKMLPSDRYFLTELLKNTRYDFDSKKLADYFDVKRVTKGLLDITSKMYGISYKTVEEQAWHPDVTVYEVWSGGKPIGKFYLDLHPRENKYKHAAMFTIRTAKTLADGTRQTPVAALVCNFPEPGQPMPHDQVVTYFHEFGHVLHHLLTNTELASFAGTNTARDFVEAPSQMFEEWAWSREVLDLFAVHKETGAKIPAELFENMVKARKTGLALHTERQLWLARLDLRYHTAEPPFDTTEILQDVHEKNFSFAYVPGTHFQSSFGHLIGYDAGYYGYQWALALAHDVLSRFKKEGLFNKKTAADWRNQVLAMGGSRDERQLIKQFLGREPSEKAYGDFLKSD